MTEFELWMGSCRNRLLHRLAGELSLAFYFLHLLFTYCNTSSFSTLWTLPVFFKQRNWSGGHAPASLGLSLVHTNHARRNGRKSAMVWGGTKAQAVGAWWCLSSLAVPVLLGTRGLLFQVLKTRFFPSTAVYTIELYSLCGEEWEEKGTCCIFLSVFVSHTVLGREGGGQNLCLISVAGLPSLERK